LLTVFGKVAVTRLAYRRRGHANLHPADSDLNLPVELQHLPVDYPDGRVIEL
jgi:hypothetical protein